jgi:hypothetical protein
MGSSRISDWQIGTVLASTDRSHTLRQQLLTLTLTMVLKGAFVVSGQSHAQTHTSSLTTTGVFALLKAKPGVTRERVMAIRPAEIRATVQLYLDGKIREWHPREDGRGGVFLLNTGDVAEAKSIMESLPLAKENMRITSTFQLAR